jgi:hypothetical protein
MEAHTHRGMPVKWSPDWEEMPPFRWSQEERYAEWIKAHYPTPDAARARCASATSAMAAAFPELRRVAGLLCHGDYVEDLEHWWLVTPTGEIVDPTVHQYNTMMILSYYEITETSPVYNKRRHKCMNCGSYYYGGSAGCCSEVCYRDLM